MRAKKRIANRGSPGKDRDRIWRIIYRVDDDAIIIADVFAKKKQATPKLMIETSRRRLRQYDEVAKGER
jgi:phage-related protein